MPNLRADQLSINNLELEKKDTKKENEVQNPADSNVAQI